MKYYLLLLPLLLIALSGCKEDVDLDLQLDNEGYYKGFDDLNNSYKLEAVVDSDTCVFFDSQMFANKDLLETFIRRAKDGEAGFLRIAKFYSDHIDQPYFMDLYFQDDSYYAFDSSVDQEEAVGFSYLLTLDGEFGNPVRENQLILLTNDDSVTFAQWTKAIFSSQLSVSRRIDPYKLISWDMVEDREKSVLFTDKEIAQAIDVAWAEFQSFKDCDLLGIWYDEEASNDYLGQDAPVSHQMILMFEFHVGNEPANAAYKKNFTYEGMHWILERDDESSPWLVKDWGI